MAHGSVTTTKEGCYPFPLIDSPKDRSRKPLNPTLHLDPQTEEGSGIFFCILGSAPGTGVVSEADVPELCIGSWGPIYRCRGYSIQPQLPGTALLYHLSHHTPNFTPGPSPPNLNNSSLPSRTDILCRLTVQRLQE